MSSLLQQLEEPSDPSAVLLMYLAGELSAEDHAEVDRRVTADAALRDQLLALREAEETVFGALGQLDAATPLPMSESAAVRGASLAIRQWQARQAGELRPRPLVGAVGRGAQRASRWRTWAIPVSAAAVVLVVLGLAFSRQLGKKASVAERPHDPVAPVAVPTPVASSASSADDLVPLFNVKSDDPEVIDVAAREDVTSREDGSHEDGNREDVADAKPLKPLFDIPLDPG